MLSSLIWGGSKEEQQSSQPEVHEISDDDDADQANDEEAEDDQDEEQRYTAAQKGKGRAVKVGRTSRSKIPELTRYLTAGLAKAD
jgi:hypothetical protein